ncbi:hypothetical protein BGX20_001820 [Mortierella sp. AD010]|nr:hypothetical protein BGX20_001820 [Mortierella sp. AD010]
MIATQATTVVLLGLPTAMSLLACANGYPASIPHGLARSFEYDINSNIQQENPTGKSNIKKPSLPTILDLEHTTDTLPSLLFTSLQHRAVALLLGSVNRSEYSKFSRALGFGQFVIHQLTESTQIVLYQIGKVKDQERPGKDDNSDDSNDTNLDVNALMGINEENEEDDSEGQDEDLWDKDMETRDWGPLDISSRILRRQRTKTMQTDLKLGNSETEIWNSIQNNDDDDSGKFRNPFAIGIQEENDYLQQEKLGDESSESINYYGCGFVRRFEKCSTSENMPSASEDCRGVYHIVVTLIQ